MKIFAIADTHLSGQPPAKPMTVFGDNWLNHWDKIKTDWLSRVGSEDVVLLAGDISWAMTLAEALEDLNEIAALPGKIIIVKGNHDYWWQTIAKMNNAIGDRLTFLHNSFAVAGEFAVCGSRGWLCPDDPAFNATDLPIYLREISRVKASITAAQAAGYRRTILMLHYPPLYRNPSAFSQLFSQFQVELCVYGHLHAEATATAPCGEINGTRCQLVSCDALDFKLQQII